MRFSAYPSILRFSCNGAQENAVCEKSITKLHTKLRRQYSFDGQRDR